MEFLDVIRARRSVRAYTGEPVSRETLEQLLHAAVQAPTGMNLQPWAFGVIQGVERLKSLSDCTKAFILERMDQFPGLERYREMFANPESNLCHGASAMIVVFGKPNGITTDNDCSMAAYNIMLAAANMGLGSCWVGFAGFTLNTPEMKRQLGVPEDYRVIAPLIIGRAQGVVPPVDKAAPEVLFWQE